MAPTPDGMRVTPENAQEVGQRDELKNYTKAELMFLADSKTDSKESKETFIKSLEFEPDTFKLDSTGWKEVTEADKDDPILGKFVGTTPKVKVNTIGDVVEYLDGPAKGEQIFITYQALIREIIKAKDYRYTKEEVEARYLMTIDEFKKKMEDKPDIRKSAKYKNFFDQEIKGHLAGAWDPKNKEFCPIGDRSGMWLVGGDNAFFYKDGWDQSNNDRDYGFSGRLLKN